MTMPMGGDGIGIKNLQLALARWTTDNLDVGLATGGTNTTVDDTRKNWPVNVWLGGRIKIVKANGQEYTRAIASNLATQITFAALPGVEVVAPNDLYSVRAAAAVTDISDRWARQLGQIDLARVLGAALAHANPVISRLTDGAAFIDPRAIRALIATDIVTVQSLTQWGGVPLTGRDISLDLARLDITLSVLARTQRWGRNVDPAWVHAVEQVAPGAGAALVTRAVTAAMVGYIYGFFISAQEANNFLLNWTSGGAAYSKRIIFGGAGSTECVDPVPLNEGLPADATTNVTITNVNAGGAGMVYQANLLYVEV